MYQTAKLNVHLLVLLILCGVAAESIKGASAYADLNLLFETPPISISIPPQNSKLIAGSIKTDSQNNSIAYVYQTTAGMQVAVNQWHSSTYDTISKDSIVFSPLRNRFGFVAVKNGKMAAVIDGREGDWYDAVDNVVFSPDGAAVAYRVKNGNSHYIVHNNRVGKRYDGIFKVTGLIYSADSKNLAYIGLQKKQMVLVVNGKELIICAAINEVQFASNSKHIAYVAKIGSKYVVVRDDKKSKFYDRAANLIFSPDSRNLAYIAMEKGNWFAVNNAQKTPSGDMAGLQTYSPDSTRFAYALKRAGVWNFILENQEGISFDQPGFFQFSPDSKHYAYSVLKGGNWYIVTEKGVGPAFDRVAHFIFSKNSARFAYKGFRDNKWYIVSDSDESMPYDWVDTMVFSSDSKHFAYNAISDKQAFVVADGKEGAFWENVGPLVYSPDSMHLVYSAKKDDKWFYMLDDKPYDKYYDGFLNDAPFRFDSNNRFNGIAFRFPGPEFFSVTVNIL